MHKLDDIHTVYWSKPHVHVSFISLVWKNKMTFHWSSLYHTHAHLPLVYYIYLFIAIINLLQANNFFNLRSHYEKMSENSKGGLGVRELGGKVHLILEENWFRGANCTLDFIGSKAHVRFLWVWGLGGKVHIFRKKMVKIPLTSVMFLIGKWVGGQSAHEHIFSGVLFVFMRRKV